MGISINLRVPLADLISTSKPHLQRLPGDQLSGIADCSVSSVSIDAISIQQDSTQVNIGTLETFYLSKLSGISEFIKNLHATVFSFKELLFRIINLYCTLRY